MMQKLLSGNKNQAKYYKNNNIYTKPATKKKREREKTPAEVKYEEEEDKKTHQNPTHIDNGALALDSFCQTDTMIYTKSMSCKHKLENGSDKFECVFTIK